MTRRFLIICALLCGPGILAGQPPPMAAGLEPVLEKTARFEYGQSREALTQLTEFVAGSLGSPEQLRRIEARLLGFLQSRPSPAGRDFVLSQLALIATDASIPVLLTLQGQAETAETARMILERIPGPAAGEALRKLLAKATGNTRIGIINSLGRRRDPASAPVLAALISPADKGVTEAVLAALAGIADPPSAKALAAARSTLRGVLREEASEAYAACADQLAKRGDRAGAVRMYREMLTPRESPVVRIRALSGLAELEGKNAIPALTAALRSADRWEQAAAVAFLRAIPGPEGARAMAAEFPKLPAPGQVRVLAALADRGGAEGKPLVMEALKNNSGDVRAAGLDALGRLGDESSVMVLAKAAAERPGPEQEAARRSLWALAGAKIDPAIVAGIGSTSGAVKLELIVAAGERGIASAADILSAAAGDGDPEVRRAAVRALKNSGGPEHLPVLLDLVLKASTAADRKEATQTLSSLLQRSQPAQIRGLRSAYESASSVDARLSLLEAMGQSSNEAALPMLRTGLSDSNPVIARGAILALTGWERPSALADLLAAAKNSTDPVLKVLALRGYIKQVSLPSERPVSESARLLSEALQLAKEPAEKKSILSIAPSYPCPESLQLAESLLNDGGVANEARAAVTRLRAALRRN